MLTYKPPSGTKCRIINNQADHFFEINDIITAIDETLWFKNEITEEEWYCYLEDLELVESSPLVEMFSKLISH